MCDLQSTTLHPHQRQIKQLLKQQIYNMNLLRTRVVMHFHSKIMVHTLGTLIQYLRFHGPHTQRSDPKARTWLGGQNEPPSPCACLVGAALGEYCAVSISMLGSSMYVGKFGVDTDLIMRSHFSAKYVFQSRGMVVRFEY